MFTRNSILLLAVINLMITTSAHARLNMNNWERFNRTTVLIVLGSVIKIQHDGSVFSTATIEVDKVILNESDVKNISSNLEINFSPNDFQPIDTGSDYLRSNTNEQAYFFLGRYEGLWRFSDSVAGIWEIKETQSENNNKRVLCFPSTYIKHLPAELFEKLYIPTPHVAARHCRPNTLTMYIMRRKSVYYSDYYITETKLLKYFSATKHNQSMQRAADALAE